MADEGIKFWLEVDEDANTKFVSIVGCLNTGGFRPVCVSKHHGHTAIMYLPYPCKQTAMDWIRWLEQTGGFDRLKEKGLRLVECGHVTDDHVLYRIEKES